MIIVGFSLKVNLCWNIKWPVYMKAVLLYKKQMFKIIILNSQKMFSFLGGEPSWDTS